MKKVAFSLSSTAEMVSHEKDSLWLLEKEIPLLTRKTKAFEQAILQEASDKEIISQKIDQLVQSKAYETVRKRQKTKLAEEARRGSTRSVAKQQPIGDGQQEGPKKSLKQLAAAKSRSRSVKEQPSQAQM